MNKIKRNLPLIITAFIAAVGVAAALMVNLGIASTQVNIEESKAGALADFAIHGQMCDGSIRQSLTLEKGELHNDFSFGGMNNSNYTHMASMWLAEGVDISSAKYNADNRSYQLTTKETAAYVTLYDDANTKINSAIRVNTGLKSAEPKTLVGDIFTVNGEKRVNAFSDNSSKQMQVTTASLGGKTYFTLSTHSGIAGRRGVWRIDEYAEIVNDETLTIDGYPYSNMSTPVGKAPQCITLADESVDTVAITATKDSLCLFAKKDGQLVLMVYDEAMRMTDTMVVDDASNGAFTLCPQEIDTDIAFRIPSKSMALRIEGGKIKSEVSVTNPASEEITGMVLNTTGNKMLLCSFAYDNNKDYMRVYTKDGLAAELTLVSNAREDYKTYNSSSYRSIYFNTKGDDEVWSHNAISLNDEQNETEVTQG